jgi:hypothetical protein
MKTIKIRRRRVSLFQINLMFKKKSKNRNEWNETKRKEAIVLFVISCCCIVVFCFCAFF